MKFNYPRNGKQTKLKLSLSVFAIRWWVAGAIYFFIGWGSRIGRYTSLVDQIFFFGIIVGVVNAFAVNPVLKMIFDVGWHKIFGKKALEHRFLFRFVDILLGFISVAIVIGLYGFINNTAKNILTLPSDEIFLPAEPILFGLFYGVIITAILKLISLLRRGNT